MAEIDKYAQENVVKMLIGNKADLAERRQVSYEEGFQLGKLIKYSFS